MPVKRAFDAIKDIPELLRILAERDFTWKKFLQVLIPFALLALAFWYWSPQISKMLMG
jgi:hypothetical protein